MHLWVGEAIMPQITTWLIVSEQMSRLSEIWAWLVCKLPFSAAFSQVLAKFTDKTPGWRAARVSCGLADVKQLKRGRLTTRPQRKIVSDVAYCVKSYTTTQNKQWNRLVVSANSPHRIMTDCSFAFLWFIINTTPLYLFFITLHEHYSMQHCGFHCKTNLARRIPAAHWITIDCTRDCTAISFS